MTFATPREDWANECRRETSRTASVFVVDGELGGELGGRLGGRRSGADERVVQTLRREEPGRHVAHALSFKPGDIVTDPSYTIAWIVAHPHDAQGLDGSR